MSQPLDRTRSLPAIGKIDEEAGEFWTENPFLMPARGENLSAYERNCLFLNQRGSDFVDASYASLADIDSDSRSVIAADFDGDQAVDLLVGSVGGGPLRLFRNVIPAQNSVSLQLRGSRSNAQGIGCRVRYWCGDQEFVRDLLPANGCMGVAPTQLLLGTGKSSSIDRLEVRWPSGHIDSAETLDVNRRYSLIEGERIVGLSSRG